MQENIVRLQVSVDDILGVQIVHALRHLSTDVDQRAQLKLGLVHVNVFVQTRALAPLRHDGQRRFTDAAHEQEDVAVAGLL